MGYTPLNIKEVIRSKNPTLARWMPAPLIAYIERILHQRELNRFLEQYGDLPPTEFIRRSLNEMQIHYHSRGLERIDPKGRYLFASNHPFGGLDGLILCEELDRSMGKTRIIVNDLLMHLTPIAELFIPINKHGRQSSACARNFQEALSAPIQIATFPAGLCSRKIEGKVVDTPWRHNFVKSAIEYQRDIVPVHFDGTLSPFFYRLSRIRKRLGIKANIEMFYLCNEMFKQRGSSITIHYGKPIPWQSLTKERTTRQWCEYIRQKSYALQDE